MLFLAQSLQPPLSLLVPQTIPLSFHCLRLGPKLVSENLKFFHLLLHESDHCVL